MKRRDFLLAAGGSAAATAAASHPAVAQEDEGGDEENGGDDGGGDDGGGDDGGGDASVQPDFEGWVSGANVGSYEDMRGEDEVTVNVGAGDGLAFDPTGIWVDPDTTVTWEWTGNGGAHTVVAQEGPADLDSGDPASEGGETYEHTFEEGGITKYVCEPHEGQGMQGAVAVGEDVPTKEIQAGEKELHELGVPIQAHWVGTATILGIILTINYTFYVLKYGESPNTGNTGGGED